MLSAKGSSRPSGRSRNRRVERSAATERSRRRIRAGVDRERDSPAGPPLDLRQPTAITRKRSCSPNTIGSEEIARPSSDPTRRVAARVVHLAAHRLDRRRGEQVPVARELEGEPALLVVRPRQPMLSTVAHDCTQLALAIAGRGGGAKERPRELDVVLDLLQIGLDLDRDLLELLELDSFASSSSSVSRSAVRTRSATTKTIMIVAAEPATTTRPAFTEPSPGTRS